MSRPILARSTIVLSSRISIPSCFTTCRGLLPTCSSSTSWAFFERGVGVVVLHHALAGLQQWSTFEEITGLRMREKGEGGLPAYTYQHNVNFALQRVDVQHPALDGVPSFSVFDEAYGRMYYHPDIQPLMVTNHPASIPVVVWARTYKNSRLVMIQPGHGPRIFGNPNFRRLIANSIAWVSRQ
jgi:type 1 glutamine amidotransferase